jgi:signal transduction histidine kinase
MVRRTASKWEFTMASTSRLRIRDDGRGIDAKFVAEKGRPGHYGLRDMTERAIGGNLVVCSNVESGTEIELTIPSSAVYTSTAQRRAWLARKEDSASPD